MRSCLPLIGVLLATSAFAHDEIIGARYVQGDGANASDCLDHDAPCQSIQFALTQAEPGNTVRVAAGIYDMRGVDPNQLREVAHLDTFLAPGANSAGTDGAWGVYPFLPSGTVLISDISNGLFVLKDKAATLANSAGQIGFIGTTATVSENAGTATVRLQRSGGYMGAVSIQYQTSDGTATTGSDYSSTSGTLTWPALDTTERSFTVPLTNDTQTESDETFTIALGNASGGANIEGSPTFAITVSNDDVAASPPPPAAGGGGGGGGGAMSLDVLLLLAALLLADAWAHRLLPSRSRKPDRTGSCRH